MPHPFLLLGALAIVLLAGIGTLLSVLMWSGRGKSSPDPAIRSFERAAPMLASGLWLSLGYLLVPLDVFPVGMFIAAALAATVIFANWPKMLVPRDRRADPGLLSPRAWGLSETPATARIARRGYAALAAAAATAALAVASGVSLGIALLAAGGVSFVVSIVSMILEVRERQRR